MATTSSSVNCDNCSTLKSKIRETLRAFSLLSRFNSDLKPDILVQNIQKILDESDEPDDEISIVHENDIVDHAQLFKAFKLLSDSNPNLDRSIFHTSLENLFKSENGLMPRKLRVVKKEKRSREDDADSNPNPDPDLEIVNVKSRKRTRASETPNPLSILPPPDSQVLDNLPFIPWGSHVSENSLYNFTNTCTIDNGLMVLTLLFKYFPSVLQYFQEIADSPTNPKLSTLSTDILTLIKLIESKNEYNSAKTMWIQKICKTFKKPLIEASVAGGHLNCLWGSEDDMFLRPLKKLMEKYVEIQQCKEHGVVVKEKIAASSFAKGRMQDIADLINLQIQSKDLKCTQKDCKNEIIRRTGLMEGCQPLPFQVFHVHDETEVETVPKVIEILETEYQLFCASMYSDCRKHFFASFDWDGSWITYDGMKNKFQPGLLSYDYISLLWYIKK